jgi:hypothetical protein
MARRTYDRDLEDIYEWFQGQADYEERRGRYGRAHNRANILRKTIIALKVIRSMGGDIDEILPK